MNTCPEREDFTANFWGYYRMLENDCILLRRFVSFRKENLSTCSDEIVKQLLSAASEFDNLCKEITNIKNGRPTIVDYGKYFFSDSSSFDLKSVEVALRNSDIILVPFSKWGNKETDKMPWWNAYNLVKHNRNEYYHLGSLGNLLDAVAALYFLERYHYKQISLSCSNSKLTVFDIPPDQSELFYLKNFKTVAFNLGNGLIGTN